MGLQHMAMGHVRYFGLVRGPHVKKVAANDTPNRLNYSVNFVVHTQFTYMEAGRTIQIGGPRVGNPYSKRHGTSADLFL